MNIIVSTEELNTINDLTKFIDGNQKAAYAILGNKSEKYSWINRTLIKFQYYKLKKHEKGIVIKYLMTVTRYSRQQITRLIKKHINTGEIKHNQSNNNGFKKQYDKNDIAALAKIDEIHGSLNGKATKRLCYRAYHNYNDKNYEKLSNISVSHLYNLRNSIIYRNKKLTIKKTKPVASSIGKRCKPVTYGKPGYLRIDTVHQGDLDKEKGVYHINAVDEVTQFEVVYTVERINEKNMKKALSYILNAFPFKILGFHSDNGSEYVNYAVNNILKKLNIDFTKSRARKSNDNGLVESKNGSIIRKTFGYEHISKNHAKKINNFNRQHLNFHINYHRPCLFATDVTDKKGKIKKVYKYQDVLTPYEKLKSIDNYSTYLKEGVTIDDLEYKANMLSDNDSAKQTNTALQRLFNDIFIKGQNEPANLLVAS